jgi:hypothetical protein
VSTKKYTPTFLLPKAIHAADVSERRMAKSTIHGRAMFWVEKLDYGSEAFIKRDILSVDDDKS